MFSKATAEFRPRGAAFGWVTALHRAFARNRKLNNNPAQKAGFMARGRARYQRGRVVATKGGG